MQAGFGKPGLISQANTGPAPAKPCPGRTGVSKAAAPHLGPHLGEADFTGGTRRTGRLSDSVGPAGRPPPVCSLVPLPAGPCPAPTQPGPQHQGGSRSGRGLLPCQQGLVRPPSTHPDLGWVSGRLLPALSFSFTLVFNPKAKLKTGTTWER